MTPAMSWSFSILTIHSFRTCVNSQGLHSIHFRDGGRVPARARARRAQRDPPAAANPASRLCPARAVAIDRRRVARAQLAAAVRAAGALNAAGSNARGLDRLNFAQHPLRRQLVHALEMP